MNQVKSLGRPNWITYVLNSVRNEIKKEKGYVKLVKVNSIGEDQQVKRNHNHNHRGARWCRGMFGALQPEGSGFESTSGGIFGALQPEGCGLESTSSCRVGTLGKSFTHNCSCASA